MIVLRCTRSRVASARVPGRGSPGLRRPFRMSLASASESCTNIGESRRESSAAVSSSQLSIDEDRTGPVDFEEGDLQGDPVVAIHSWALPEEDPCESSPHSSSPCCSDVERTDHEAPQTASAEIRQRRDDSNPNPMLFPKDARPYGRTPVPVGRADVELHLLGPGGSESVLRHDRCELRRRSGRAGVVPAGGAGQQPWNATSRGAAPSRRIARSCCRCRRR